MPKLTSKTRKKLPAKEFAGPGRSYPIPDKAHAADAKGRAKQQYKKGRISKATLSRIDSKADKKLGKK
jgi:hypothetical protein